MEFALISSNNLKRSCGQYALFAVASNLLDDGSHGSGTTTTHFTRFHHYNSFMVAMMSGA